MNDLLEVRSDEREGVPGRVRRLAQSGGGWSRSNLYDDFVSFDLTLEIRKCHDTGRQMKTNLRGKTLTALLTSPAALSHLQVPLPLSFAFPDPPFSAASMH